ncbi:MAG: hypothetical protein R3D56_03905 [Paracoccaceae bacterium]
MTKGARPGTYMRAMHRPSARLSTLARPATGFAVSQSRARSGPMPGASSCSAGNFLFAGFLIESRDKAIWEIAIPDHRFEDELHGFAWLDDLAAVGDAVARQRADWTFGWIARYGRGPAPGCRRRTWTGRRLIR